jgi:hypothetical protein
MTRRIAPAVLACLLIGLALTAAETTDSNVNWRIRQEATENSQVMRLIHSLTDIHGPRVTGSPGFTAACQWAVEQFRQWGLQNENLETWDFGHFGWGNDRCSVRVVSPFKADLSARVIAWTPGTKGIVRASAVQIDPPDKPSQENLTAYLNSIRDRVRGKIVFVGEHKSIPITFNAPQKRREESDLIAQYDPDRPVPVRTPEEPAEGPKPLEPREVDTQIDTFLVGAGALVKVVDAARDHGQISVFANRTYDCSKAIPGMVIRNEDYGRISRTIADASTVEMEIEISNTVYDRQLSWNVVAEIPGTDKKSEAVMMGAHLDSWHAGTGATDNAAGVAVVMEATRILQKLGLKPRRTVRVALWGGEEQGLLGSKAYVRDHFGTFEESKPEFSNLTAYINIDSGTGRVRGASVFGPSEAAAAVRQILEAFRDLGVVGANSIIERQHAATDSTSFSWAGLPSINLSQDPIEYFTHSWHTNLDTYERVLETDLKQCAIVIASLAYHLAMREEMLPRFTAEAMPKPGK